MARLTKKLQKNTATAIEMVRENIQRQADLQLENQKHIEEAKRLLAL
jgi:hypothetical protein